LENLPSIESLQINIQESDVKLNAVIDLTNAINSNQPLNGMAEILSNYLLADLGVEFLAYKIYEDGNWVVGYHSHPTIELPEIDNRFKEVVSIGHFAHLSEQQYIIPVFYNQDIYAYSFLDFKSEVPDAFVLARLNFLQNILNIMVVAIENEKLMAYRLRQEAIRKEIEIARQVQTMLFPKNLPQNSLLEVNATYIPHMSVSGDYYDYIRIDDTRFMLCIADVSGKGMSAALLMSNFQATLRTLVMQQLPLESIVVQLNTILCQNSNLERFITAFICICDTAQQSIQYVNSGHNPPVLIRNQTELIYLNKGTTVLGVFPELPFINSETVDMANETLFVGFTDGLTETENPNGDEYSPERMYAFIAQLSRLPLEQLHNHIYEELLHFSDGYGFKDDITILSCRVQALK
jgi:sigma-B regulation protein RsbU (phosphoserine phosphatase)